LFTQADCNGSTNLFELVSLETSAVNGLVTKRIRCDIFNFTSEIDLIDHNFICYFSLVFRSANSYNSFLQAYETLYFDYFFLLNSHYGYDTCCQINHDYEVAI